MEVGTSSLSGCRHNPKAFLISFFFCVRVDLREREEWVNNWKRSTRIKEIVIKSKWRERIISERDKNQNSLRFRWQSREVRHRIESRDESKRIQRKTDGNNEREKQGRASKIRAVSYRGSHLKRGRVPTATGAAPCLHVIDHHPLPFSWMRITPTFHVRIYNLSVESMPKRLALGQVSITDVHIAVLAYTPDA